MTARSLVAAVALLFCAGLAAADEVDAVITDATRASTKRKDSPDKFSYGRITLDSKGKLISMTIREGRVTPETTVAMGTFDEKTKTWTPGEAIAGGILSDLFQDKGKTLRVRLRVADDKTTVRQILVTNTDEKLERASGEFDAIFKGHGNTNDGGYVGFAYVRIELDEQGKLINKFPLVSTAVGPETKFVMGKYDEEAKRWTAGEEIAGGVWHEMFKDPGAKTIYIRITQRDDGRGIAQVLVRQIGKSNP
jgi:hypothetical protein